VAILPALMATDADLPVAFLAGVLLVLVASGALWTWLATAFATRGDPLPALRDE